MAPKPDPIDIDSLMPPSKLVSAQSSEPHKPRSRTKSNITLGSLSLSFFLLTLSLAYFLTFPNTRDFSQFFHLSKYEVTKERPQEGEGTVQSPSWNPSFTNVVDIMNENSAKSEEARVRVIPLFRPSTKPASPSANPIRRFCKHFLVPIWSKNYQLSVTAQCIEEALARSTDMKKDIAMEGGPENAGGKWEFDKALHPRFSFDSFFTLFYAHLERSAPGAFLELRQSAFNIPEEVYQQTLLAPLKPLSGLGLSGSVFFHTDPPINPASSSDQEPSLTNAITQKQSTPQNAGSLIKSIARSFEYTFLHAQLLPAYIQYVTSNHGDTLLTRITDVLSGREISVGGLAKVSPRHWIVMADLLGDLFKDRGGKKWDLKPSGFFEPTRDLVPDAIKSDATISGLADALDPADHILLSPAEKAALLRALERDTKWLEDMGTIDYSLLVGRWPIELENELQLPVGYDRGGLVKWVLDQTHRKTTDEALKSDLREQEQEEVSTRDRIRQTFQEWTGRPGGEGESDAFTRGIKSSDGKWIYRFSIVDFMWNVHMLRPMITKAAGKALPEQTITTEPDRYRIEFIKMVDEYVNVTS